MLLRSKDKQTLLEIFSGLAIPVEVWAYGSRVKKTSHDGSDLDLVIRTPDLQKLPLDILVKLKEKIRKSNIPIIVDLFDWARLPETFHRNIEASHEVLFSSDVTTLKEPQPDYKKPGKESDM